MNAVLEITKQSPTTEVFQNGQVLNARLISVKEYDQMIEHGILTTEDKVELLKRPRPNNRRLSKPERRWLRLKTNLSKRRDI